MMVNGDVVVNDMEDFSVVFVIVLCCNIVVVIA